MAECKDCARYVPNDKFDPKKILSAVGYCRIPVRDTGGLMGTVEAGETLNITFARGPYRCRDGTRWFEPKPSDGVMGTEAPSPTKPCTECGGLGHIVVEQGGASYTDTCPLCFGAAGVDRTDEKTKEQK